MLARVIVVLGALSVAAFAAPVQYIVSGTYSDSGKMGGSFVFDPVTGVYSNVSITTSAGTVRGGQTYTFVCGTNVPTCTGVVPNSSGALTLTSTAGDQTGLPALSLFFTPALTATGTFVLFSLEANCNNAACAAPAGPTRTFSNGVAFAVQPGTIPTLSEWGMILFTIVLAGYGALRTRSFAVNAG